MAYANAVLDDVNLKMISSTWRHASFIKFSEKIDLLAIHEHDVYALK